MSRPKILTIYLDTWYGTGRGVSSERMQFGDGLFDQLGWEETHVPLESLMSLGDYHGKYDLVFTVPYQQTIAELRDFGPVVAWMSDDVWRQDFGRQWADVSDLVVTTDPNAARRYGDKGLLSNWACRPEWLQYAPPRLPALTASFHGQLYGKRRDRLAALEAALPVSLIATDTAEGYVHPEDYFRGVADAAFSICLTESSHGVRQMKSRLFEPQLFGSVLVTEPVDGLEHYWEPGRECVVFSDPDDCARQVALLAASYGERTAMAERARKRLLAEHTYQKRFAAVFDRLGVSV